MREHVREKIRILYIHHGSGSGGAPKSLLYLLQGLDKNRYEPFVACDFDKSNAMEFFIKNGFEPINLPVAIFSHVWPSGW